MTENQRRHASVVNVEEVEALENVKGSKFAAKIRGLGRASGAKELGCNWFEVPAGKTSFPCHWHGATEEALFILQGRGTLRIGNERVEVGVGDWVALPPGPECAHQLLNTGTEPLRYLCVSTKPKTEVVGYPDSNKIAAVTSASAEFAAKPWVRAIFKAESSVDYYEGESSE